MSPGDPTLCTTVSRSDRSVLVCAHGELDVATAPELRRVLLDAVTDGATDGPTDGAVDLVVDLAGVTFVDATGLGALLHGAEAARTAGGDLRVASPSRMLRVMLRLLDLEAELPLVAGREGSVPEDVSEKEDVS